MSGSSRLTVPSPAFATYTASARIASRESNRALTDVDSRGLARGAGRVDDGDLVDIGKGGEEVSACRRHPHGGRRASERDRPRYCTARKVVDGDAVAHRDIELFSELDHGSGRLTLDLNGIPGQAAVGDRVLDRAVGARRNKDPRPVCRHTETGRAEGKISAGIELSVLEQAQSSLCVPSRPGDRNRVVSGHNLCIRPELRRGYRGEIAGTEEGHGLVVRDDDVSRPKPPAQPARPGLARLAAA